jgi:hypothetical protein
MLYQKAVILKSYEKVQVSKQIQIPCQKKTDEFSPIKNIVWPMLSIATNLVMYHVLRLINCQH